MYGPLVFHWCVRDGLQGADARDVTQEVLRTLAEQITRFRVDDQHSSFRGWLRIMTQRRLVDHHRRSKRELAGGGGTSLQQALEQMPAPDASATDDLSQAFPVFDLLERARLEVSDRAWQAFWRTTVDGRSGPEVAAELGCSEAAVYTAKSRVLARIRALAEGERRDP
jgi:RNA polymerase sigma-70 factor (ECF subfamily)